MKDKIKVLIFGASGTIGKNLVRRLTRADYIVTCQTRNRHRSVSLMTQGAPGYIIIEECQLFDEEKIRELVKQNSIVINLVGILSEQKKSNKINTFQNIHEKFPYMLSSICKDYNVEQFIHMSSLGIDESSIDSIYAKSKLNGEAYIKKNFNSATILRSSVVYGVDDKFTNLFASLLSNIPFIFPLYYEGSTLFKPINISDLTEIIYQIIVQQIKSKTLECVGPEEISIKNILQRILKIIGKNRIFIPIPLPVAKLIAIFFSLFPKPLLDLEQLRLLKYNNIPSGKYETNFDIGIPSKSDFDTELKKFLWMYSDRGQFSQPNYKENN
tara:strand:- start:5316 stop:6296 length:981 start_codon:yes stop_codon:yes gene_type:complete